MEEAQTVATSLLPAAAHIEPPQKFHSPESLLIYVDADGSKIVSTLSSLSPASQYHLNSLLRYGEVGIINSAISNPPTSKSPNEEKEFTLYKKLPPELRMAIWNDHIQANPRRITLSTFRDHVICVGRKYPIPAQLHVSRQVRSEGFKTYGYVELKRATEVNGVVVHPEVDMLLIDDIYAADIFPQRLQDTARESQALEKIRSIGIWESHVEFENFLDSFKNYSTLELVLIVVGEGPQRRPWGVAEETRVAEKNEIMFEVLDTNSVPGQYLVPQFDVSSGKFLKGSHTNYPRWLYSKMARANRETPHIRFVREVNCMSQRRRKNCFGFAISISAPPYTWLLTHKNIWKVSNEKEQETSKFRKRNFKKQISAGERGNWQKIAEFVVKVEDVINYGIYYALLEQGN
ncbi:hypothetical protein N431DRAFT_445600 [Stipitochalara longipes BDJ]|nr:hypothetical protein N431DRAFT_445600 [Stipitochalara longipes BDJ]